jgi:hypothetical protein
VSTTPRISLSPVSLTPAITACPGFPWITGVVDNGRKFLPVSPLSLNNSPCDNVFLSRDGILGHEFDKRFEPFCSMLFTVSSLADFTENYTLLLFKTKNTRVYF